MEAEEPFVTILAGRVSHVESEDNSLLIIIICVGVGNIFAICVCFCIGFIFYKKHVNKNMQRGTKMVVGVNSDTFDRNDDDNDIDDDNIIGLIDLKRDQTERYTKTLQAPIDVEGKFDGNNVFLSEMNANLNPISMSNVGEVNESLNEADMLMNRDEEADELYQNDILPENKIAISRLDINLTMQQTNKEMSDDSDSLLLDTDTPKTLFEKNSKQ